MTRLILALLLALSLVGSPATAAIPSPPGCTMDDMAHGKAGDQSKMDCCTATCTMAVGAALLPAETFGAPAILAKGLDRPTPADAEFRSVNPAAVDPPPRALPA